MGHEEIVLGKLRYGIDVVAQPYPIGAVAPPTLTGVEPDDSFLRLVPPWML